jgi:outer membrane receptor protein involved in Fe transport
VKIQIKSGPALWVMSAALVAVPLPALAQTSGQKPPADQATDKDSPDDIIVTAQKRSQSANSVGMAITAVSGDQLQKQRITDTSGLSKLDPSFVASQSFYGTPVYTIRGVGYNDYSIAASPTVSVYSDEVPYPYLALAKAVSFDLERVEVLKGPQGTLFGQNATGGAVNYIDAKPTKKFSAGFGMSYTSRNAANFHGFVSGPITSTLSARLAFDVNEGGAWQKSFSRPLDKLGDKDQQRFRGILDWQPSDRLKVSLTAVGWIDHSDIVAPQQIGLAVQSPGTYPNTIFADPSLAGRKFTNLVGLVATPFPTKDTQAEWAPNSFPRMDEKYYQFSGRAEYKLTDNVLFTILGSYQHYDQADNTYNTGTTTVQSSLITGRVKSAYVEARLSGQMFGDKLEWLIGGDYANVKTNEDQLTHLGTTSIFALIQLPIFLGGTKYLDPLGFVRNVSFNKNENAAVFGNLEYHVTPTLSVHGGIRYTSTILHNAASSYDVDGNLAAGLADLRILRGLPPTSPAPGTSSTINSPAGTVGLVYNRDYENNVSWRVGADWKPIPGTLVYATVSKGYKSGTYPTLPASNYIQVQAVKQESVLAYEAGVKSRFDDNRIDVTGAVFYYDYVNKQINSSVPDPLGIFGVLTALVNIPKSREYGAELALNVRPVPGVTLSASGSYLHSEVSDHFLGYNPYSTGAQIDLKGEAFPNTPKWAARAGGQYDWGVLKGSYGAYIGFDVSYSGRTEGQFGNQSAVSQGFPSLYIKPYATLDLRAGLDSRDGRWRFQIFGQNVTNTYYWTQAVHTYDTAVRYTGMPAVFGASVDYRF